MHLRIALSLLVAAASLVEGRARAFCRLTTSTTFQPTAETPCDLVGIPLEWRRPCLGYAIQVAGSDDVPVESVEVALRASFDRWTAVACEDGPMPLSLTYLGRGECSDAEFRRSGPNVPIIVFREDTWPSDYDPNAFALTSVWHSTRTGEIFDADMEFNGTRFSFGLLSEHSCGPSSLTADIENVATHEVGHFLGLAHTPDSDATMYGMACAGEIDKRSLADDDVAGICAIYPRGVDRGRCDPLPINGLDLACGPFEKDDDCSVAAPGGARDTERHAWCWTLGLATTIALVRRRRGARSPRR